MRAFKKTAFVFLFLIFIRQAQAEVGWSTVGDGSTPTLLQYLDANRVTISQPGHLISATSKGDAQFQHSLNLPPAIFKPGIGISYSSDSGWDIEMPPGWQIEGILEISRPTARAFSADEYLINGPEFSGTLEPSDSGATSHILHTTQPTYVLADYDPSDDQWTVTFHGKTYTLSAADNGASSPDGTAWWRVTQITDTVGNAIDYTYKEDGRIDYITYGGNQSTSANVKIEFKYAENSYLHTNVRYGFLIEYKHHLESIVVSTKQGKSFSRIHELNLDYATIDLVEMPVSIYRDGATEGSLVEPIASFEYTQYTASATPARSTTEVTYKEMSSFRSESNCERITDSRTTTKLATADFNGDGIPDCINSQNAGAWEIYHQEVDYASREFSLSSTPVMVNGPAAEQTRITSEGEENEDRPPYLYTIRQLVDLNSDGFPDLIESEHSTYWRITYGTGRDFESTPYNERAPPGWLYSQVSFAADVIDFESWAQDVVKTLIDLNGDGWLDCFDPRQGKAFFHKGYIGGGWEQSPSFTISPVEAFRSVHYNATLDHLLLSDTYGVGVLLDVDQYLVWTDETKSFQYDLNSDGFPDYVDASYMPWQVSLGNGYGFEEPRDWQSPLPLITRTYEGYPTISYTVQVEITEGTGEDEDEDGEEDTVTTTKIAFFEQGGRAAYIYHMLGDVDGDGLLDLIVSSGIEGGLQLEWYKNFGDGFDYTPRRTPAWWPPTLYSSQAEANTLSLSSCYSETEGSVNSTQRITDMDHDGILDDAYTSGVEYGDYPPPYKLKNVQLASGGYTDISYRSASTLAPAGNISQDQHMFIKKDVVDTLETADPMTGQTGKTSYTCQNGHYVEMVWQGFGYCWEQQEINGDWVSTTYTDYSLYRDHAPLVKEQSVSVDMNLTYAPGLARSSSSLNSIRFEVSNNYAEKGVEGNFLLLNSSAKTEYGEASSAKVINLTYVWDDWGNLLTYKHDGGGVTTDAFQINAEYTSDSEQTFFRLSHKDTVGFDHLSGVTRYFDWIDYLYDNNGSNTDTLTEGLVTEMVSKSGWEDGGTIFDDEHRVTFSRDSNGLVTQVYDQTTGLTVDQTYGFGGVLKTQTNNLGHTIRNTIDSRGRITATQDPSGIKKVMVYDDHNRIIQEKIVGNTVKSPQTLATHSYQASTMPFYTTNSLYNSSGGIDSTSYGVSDGLGHEAQTCSPDMSGDYLCTNKIYDVRGNLIQTGHPVSGAAFIIPSSITIADTLTQSYYDAFGKVRENIKDVNWGTGSSLLYLDEPWESLSVDESSFFTKLYYDAHGRIIKVKQGQMVHGDIGTATLMAQYQYDPLNRLVKYIDANNNVITYSYDGLGRLRRVNRGTTSSLQVPWYTYEYNGAWRTKMTDNTGAFTSWEYDDIGRPTHVEMTDPLDTTDGIAEYEKTYDTVLTGALSQTEDPTGTTAYTYDRYGRVQTITRSFTDYPSITFSYELDLQGKQTAKTLPSGYQLQSSYSYGWLETHTGVTSSGTDFTVTYDYNDWGLMSSANSSMGHRFSQTYTTPLWPDRLRMTYGLQDYRRDYLWYGNGLMQQKEDGTNSFADSYDELKELTEVTQNGTRIEYYDYDAAGNLTQMFADGVFWNYGAAGTFNQVPNRTSGASTDNYDYDDAGRVTTWMTDGLSREYLYDGMGRLRAIHNNGTVVEEIDYDIDGQIVKRNIDNSGTMLSHYSFLDWRYDSDTGTQTEVYTSQVAAENGTKRWLFKEIDGHAAVTLSDFGVFVGSRQEGAYGLEQAIAGTPWMLNTFHGSEKESNNELYAMEQRHLMQKDGQFLQPEPLLYLGIPQKGLANPLSLSTYRYAMNSPTVYQDTSGYYSDIQVYGNNVYITVPMAFTGPAANPKNIYRFIKAGERSWSGNFGKYHVTTQVVDVTKSVVIPPLLGNVNYPSREHNIVNMDYSGSRPYVSSSTQEDLKYGNFMQLSLGSYRIRHTIQDVGPHELGHIFGRPDRYYDRLKDGRVVPANISNTEVVGIVPAPGYENNIMGAMAINGRPSEDDIQTILDDFNVTTDTSATTEMPSDAGTIAPDVRCTNP